MRSVVAFLSPGAGAGQTSTLANLAVVLAGSGRRVLVVDWVTEPPRTSEYLAPFLVDHLALDDVLGASLAAAVAANLGQVPDPDVARFALPDSTGVIDVLTVGTTTSPPDGSSPAELRDLLLGTDYDEIFVDASTAVRRAVVPEVVAELCDAVALCFTPREGAIRKAADLGIAVSRRARRQIDFIPVATMFDEQYLSRAERALGAIRAAFAVLLENQRRRLVARGAVEIPYRPYDAFDPLLAVLVEQPGPGSRLLTAYGELAAAVTDGAVEVTPAVSQLITSRYRRLYGLEAGIDLPPLVLLHDTRGRPWADWIRDQVTAAGMPVLGEGADVGSGAGTVQIAFVETEDGLGQDLRSALDRLVGQVTARGAEVEVIRLLVASAQDDPELSATTVSLADTTEERARQRLFAHFGLVESIDPTASQGSRFPGSSPRVRVLPPRNQDFVGRERELEHLRDRLAPGRSAQVQVTGPPGIGKSEFAREYAHRFAHDYDLVHWVAAHDRQALSDAMGELSARVREVVGMRGGDVLSALAADPANRWLIVYDNADDPEIVDDLAPAIGVGHVLVTTTRPHPLTGEELPLTELSAAESTLLLARHAPGLSGVDAAAVADAVRHQPLAVELVAAWLSQMTQVAGTSAELSMVVAELLGRLTGQDDDAVDAQVVDLLTETARTTPLGRVTVLLAEMCAFLSPEGADIRMLRASAVWHALVAAAGEDAALLQGGADELDLVLWAGARSGLLEVDWGRRPLVRMHRVVQSVLRELMPPDVRAVRREQLLAALAAYAPSDVDNDYTSGVRRYAELQKHVSFSGALESSAEPVRRWLVSQVRHAYHDGGSGGRWRVALALAERLIERWSAEFGDDDGLLLRLRGQAANLCRVLGDNHSAKELDNAVLGHQRRLLPRNHPQTLITARGLAADLRGLGNFADALIEDQVTWEGFRQSLGDDHPHTRIAANNLALSHYLSGDARAALDMERDNYRRRARLFGQNDMQTWWSMCSIGTYQRELGRITESVESLRTAREHVQALRPETNPLGLRIRWNQAITERHSDRVPAAADRNRRTLRDYVDQFGEKHPWTLGCRLSLAHDLRRLGDLEAAAEHTTACLTGFTQDVGLDEHHPFVAVCRMALARIRLDMGELDAAGELIQLARNEFTAHLTETHPWTQVAKYHHAAILHARGEPDHARTLVAEVHEACDDYLGRDHPYTLVTGANLRNGDWAPIDVDVPQT
ncbi:FxSxx-COOH system tetratricopeptide repeat protein [Lentzea terrae]|uniref:FxSxx-COOH system tetratricopeptide repeat protein n=1 Tax=Lentzea terrae TaxID=2200761 RepID=UPI000DD46231|nr:FxSxx-COOH system tetratricopeptide repeat protein [Lentzea terrae]